MEQVTAKISETAKMVGASERQVDEAQAIARLALSDGYSDEQAYEFARPALLGALAAA